MSNEVKRKFVLDYVMTHVGDASELADKACKAYDVVEREINKTSCFPIQSALPTVERELNTNIKELFIQQPAPFKISQMSKIQKDTIMSFHNSGLTAAQIELKTTVPRYTVNRLIRKQQRRILRENRRTVEDHD
jgi:hypothetical protein